MTCVLVTGADGGIGREFVRQYAAAGWNVLAACRRPETVIDLPAIGPGVSWFTLDVIDPQSIGRLAERLKGVAIDLLISGAVCHDAANDALETIDFDASTDLFRANVIAPLRMAAAFRAQLARSRLRLLVGIGSRMGSITMNSNGGGYLERACGAALNAVHRSLAIDLAPDGIVTVVLCPERVQTEPGPVAATQSVAESVAGMRRVIARLTPVHSGRFLDRDGHELPW